MERNKIFEALRKKEQLTQCQLADKLGICRSLISDIERGRIKVSRKVREKIKEVMGIEYDELEASDFQIKRFKKVFDRVCNPFNYCPHCGEKLN